MKSPKPPDPYQTAGAQQRSEIGAAGASSIMNNPNIVNPYGSQSYSISGWEQVPDATGKMISVPRYTQTQTLSPDQMKLLGLQTQGQYNMGQTAVEQSAKLRQHLQGGVDSSGWQKWGNIRQDQGPTDRAGVENAMMQLYNRQASGKNAAEQAQLAARGMNVGSSQYGSTAKRQGDEFTDAALKAYLGSGDEARASQAAYNEATNQMGSQRGAQMNEALALRNQPINEITALLGGSQVTMPQFSPYQGQGINAANIGQYIGNNYAQQNAATSAFNSGLFNIAGAAAGAIPWSDRRLKKDIRFIHAHLAGAPLYTFRYRFDPGTIQVGVMADEVRALHPDAVTTVNGYDQVDYALLNSRHKGTKPDEKPRKRRSPAKHARASRRPEGSIRAG